VGREPEALRGAQGQRTAEAARDRAGSHRPHLWSAAALRDAVAASALHPDGLGGASGRAQVLRIASPVTSEALRRLDRFRQARRDEAETVAGGYSSPGRGQATGSEVAGPPSFADGRTTPAAGLTRPRAPAPCQRASRPLSSRPEAYEKSDPHPALRHDGPGILHLGRMAAADLRIPAEPGIL